MSEEQGSELRAGDRPRSGEDVALRAAERPRSREMYQRCKLVPLRDGSRLKELSEAAAADNHVVLGPTHLVVRGDKIVGYGSLGGLVTLHVWLDSKSVHAGDSVRMLETAEALLADKGAGAVLMPCAENSPFAPHMERLGFKKLGATVLWIKAII